MNRVTTDAGSEACCYDYGVDMTYFPYRDHFAEAKRTRQHSCVAKALKETLVASQRALHKTLKPRAWCLPPTTVVTEVSHFRRRAEVLKAPIDLPSNAKGINATRAARLALQIRAAVEYLELSLNSADLVRPTLTYYAFSNLAETLNDTYFNWSDGPSSHGLSVSTREHDSRRVSVTIREKGRFQRLTTTLFLLTGMPTPFDRLVTYSAKPTGHTEPGGLLERFGDAERGDPITTRTVGEIAEMNLEDAIQQVKRRHGIHKGDSLPQTSLLCDVLLIYAASSCARYRPTLWQEVLDGQTESGRLIFDAAFERFATYGFDRMLALLRDPFGPGIGWQTQYYDNPYDPGAVRARCG